MQFLSSCNPKVLLVHWVEQKLVKINKRDVFLWKQRVKSRALSVWSEFKRLHIREFKPKRDKTVHNSLVNPQQILAPECLFSTLVNLPSKGNCCSDLFPDVLSRVSDCVFPARENMHRFSRWAEVMGTHPPPLVLQCVQCTQLSVWWLCTLAVSSRKIVPELPTLPLRFRPAELPAFGKTRVSTAEMKGKTVPGKVILQIMRSHIHVSILWLQGDEQNKFFSSSDLQSLLPYTELLQKKAHLPTMQTAAWERQEAPQGCVPAAGMWQATSQAALQTFRWAKHWRARAVLPCSALRQAGKERCAFLLVRCVLLPGTVFTPFFFPFIFIH